MRNGKFYKYIYIELPLATLKLATFFTPYALSRLCLLSMAEFGLRRHVTMVTLI